MTHGNSKEDVYTVVIEVACGSKNKYQIDKDGKLRLDRVLHSSMSYPANYGYIPKIFSGDGDELDVVIYSQEALQPGTYLECRIVGALMMYDEKGSDPKIIGVPTQDPHYNHINTLSELPEYRVKELIEFFSGYKELENKNVRVSNAIGKEAAISLVNSLIESSQNTTKEGKV